MEKTINQIINNHNLATVYHDAGSKKIVIFCHGYRSSSIGPNRFFVKAARNLEKLGISSFRFDQFGSGNSEGDFMESSFNDWIKTTEILVNDYYKKDYKVALWGQSMGGSTVLEVVSDNAHVAAIISWVPDASIDEFVASSKGWEEEEGQRVSSNFWSEAHSINFANCLTKIKAPTYIVQCTNDEFVSEANRSAISNSAQLNHKVDVYKGYQHSKWTFEQAEEIINKGVDFLHNIL